MLPMVIAAGAPCLPFVYHSTVSSVGPCGVAALPLPPHLNYNDADPNVAAAPLLAAGVCEKNKLAAAVPCASSSVGCEGATERGEANPATLTHKLEHYPITPASSAHNMCNTHQTRHAVELSSNMCVC